MEKKKRLVGALLFGVTLHAQSQNPPAARQVEKRQAYVRRFSAGATLAVLVLPPFPNHSSNVVTTTPAFDATYNTQAASRRAGYGLTLQAAITEHFAVNAGLFMRRVGYKMNSDISEGTDNPKTTADERRYTVKNEDTRARFYDLPVAVRYYAKGRHQPGPRFFVEGGGVVRQVSRIRTSIDTTIGTADTSCCDNTPATPAHRTVRGFLGGLGVQLIDPVGIRVVPEVRYTRWNSETFNSLSTITQRNQVEIMISLTF